MSDRDFIIQEIRKLLKEQDPFAPDDADEKLFGNKMPKRALAAILAVSTPEEQKKIKAGVKGKDLARLGIKWDSKTGTMSIGGFRKTNVPTDIMSWVDNGGPEPASLIKAKQASAAPQKAKQAPTEPQKAKQPTKAELFLSFNSKSEELKNKLIPGYSGTNPEHVKKWKNSEQFKTIQNITTGPNKDENPSVNIKKATDYINSELNKKPASPAKSTEKERVMSAMRAKSTEDMPFAEITVPTEYEQDYQKLTAGMDSGETGTCPVINQAAIGILGSDPRAIYTALINSGVISANYVPPSEPCDGLGKLIQNFQYLATKGKLRYQKKIDPSGSGAKGLTYKPTVDTPDLQKQAAAGIKKQGGPTVKQQQIAKAKAKGTTVAKKRGVVNEQMVTVDGKIGSRTAKLLKVYANKKTFDGLKGKVGVKPKPKPEKKPEPEQKARKECQVSFRSLDELTNKTALAIMGIHYCDLDKDYNIAIGGRQYKALTGTLLSGEIESKSKSYQNDAVSLASGVKTKLSNKQEPLAAYAARDIGKDEKDKTEIYGRKYSPLASVLNNSFSNMIVKFYSGTYANEKIINFTFVSAAGTTKPIIYSYPGDKDSEYYDVSRYYKGLNYNKWMLIEPGKTEERMNTFGIANDAMKDLSSVKEVTKLHFASLKKYSKALSAITDPMGQIENDPDTPSELQKCKTMVNQYMNLIKRFLRDLNSFQSSPSEESLGALAGSSGAISVAQRYTVHGDIA